MVFNSLSFILFLVITVSLYWVLPRRPRLWLICLASLFFYGVWRVEYIGIVLLSAVTDYCVSLRLGVESKPGKRKMLLLISLLVNLGLLFYFKYLNFVVGNAVSLLTLCGVEVKIPQLDIILPLGISFYTFQTISYTVDVYRGFIKPERDFILYLDYVMFFPQLVAGPILRASEVIHQIAERPPFDLLLFIEGIKRILMGLFLKCVLADTIAGMVDGGFAVEPGMLGGLDVWTLAFMFGFQIYFDFSAYSHIAIGCAKLMGITFPENFDFPYISSSPRDFWKRWHISLSSWIRDYLYLPLAKARVEDRSTGGLAVAVDSDAAHRPAPGSYLYALFMTWLIMGFWHGANWTFAAWGLYQALSIAVYRWIKPMVAAWPGSVRKFGGFFLTLPAMMLGWIFFRAASLGHAITMFGKVLSPSTYGSLGMRENIYLVAALLLSGILIAYGVREWYRRTAGKWQVMKMAGETGFYAVVVAMVFVFLRPIQQFIYFQF